MWDREYDVAAWNGTPVNLLKTVRDRGRRLNVQHMPYSNEPYVEDMGEDTRSHKFDAVFAGKDSLGQASAFVAALSSEPHGTLEHPYLGELELVYQKSSQSFSTKKGEVVLSIEFVMQGMPITLPATYSKTIDAMASDIDEWAIFDFSEAIKQLPIEELTKARDRLTTFTAKLKGISSKLQLPSILVGQIQSSITAALNTVTAIASDPRTFASALANVFGSISASISSTAAGIDYAITGNARKARNGLQSLKPTTTTALKADERLTSALITSSALKLSAPLAIAMDSKNSQSPEDQIINNRLGLTVDEIKQEITLLASMVDSLVEQATESASSTTYPLVESLFIVQQQIQSQALAISKISDTKKVFYMTETPTLVIAQQQNSTENRLQKLNTIGHPLFAKGDVAL